MCEIYKDGTATIFICKRRTTNKPYVSQRTFNCSLTDRSQRILQREKINIENFKSWIIANKKKIAKIQFQIEMTKEEKFFSHMIFSPNDFIHSAIKNYKKYLKKSK